MSAVTNVAFKNGGETDEAGWQHWLTDIHSAGIALGTNPAALQGTQHAGGANMSLDIQNGAGAILSQAATYPYWVWLSGGPANATVTAAHPSLARIDCLVMYVDESVTQNTTANNPGAMKFVTVAGTASGSPVAPSGATIQAAVGGSNPYYILANIAVAAGVTSITTSNITDLRTNIYFNGNLYGGALNTSGHQIPNSVDSVMALSNGWTPLAIPQTDTLYTPSTITANGNRSYTLVFNSINLAGLLSPGMRMQLTRTTAAPTECTLLNGSSQWFNRSTTINGMTFTNNFVVSAWIKLTSYGSGTQTIVSRYNGTSGWIFCIGASGQIFLQGFNAGSGNQSYVQSNQSVPLNKWVHVAAQLDMLTFTASTTTSYVMIDGVDVPASVARAGTNPTALIQAGNIEVGSQNAGLLLFGGKIAQVAIYSAKVLEATILGSMHQTLIGTETNLVSAYSLNNALTDLNANANTLTAQGSATATSADSPFAQGATAGLLEYGIVTAVTFATNTTLVVQVPEGSAIPVTGGVSAISYSGIKTPYGFPADTGKWRVQALLIADSGNVNVPSLNAAQGLGYNINVPIGAWRLGWKGILSETATSGASIIFRALLNTSVALGSSAILTARQNITGIAAGSQSSDLSWQKETPVILAAATTYTAIGYFEGGSGTVTYRWYGSVIGGGAGSDDPCIYADLAYL